MKKLLTIGLLSILLLTACSSVDKEVLSEDLTEATVVVVVDNKEIFSETDEFDSNNVQEITEDILDVATEGGFITTVQGHEQSAEENKWWVFEVNDGMIMAPANETLIEDGDTITWILEQF